MAFGLAGCTVKDDFADQVDRMNRAVEEARNKAIVLNILRAAHARPLSFTTLTSLSGSRNLNASFGLPTITFGPAQTGDQGQFVFGDNEVGGSSNTSFNIAVLDSKEFHSGLLQPVTPATVDFFIKQGLPPEMMFHLFGESVTITRAGKRETAVNDPTDPSYKSFVELVRQAHRNGLTVQMVQLRRDVGPALLLPNGPDLRQVIQLRRDQMTIEAVEGRQNYYQVRRTERVARLCFRPSAANADVQPICDDRTDFPSGVSSFTLGVSPGGGRVDIEIVMRSTFGIFQYLGKLVAAGKPLQSVETGQIYFDLTKSGESCFVNVDYEAQNYCVPQQGTGGRVISLLGQLVALSTSVNDLPQNNTLRITP